jgi:hypothetical protein
MSPHVADKASNLADYHCYLQERITVGSQVSHRTPNGQRTKLPSAARRRWSATGNVTIVRFGPGNTDYGRTDCELQHLTTSMTRQKQLRIGQVKVPNTSSSSIDFCPLFGGMNFRSILPVPVLISYIFLIKNSSPCTVFFTNESQFENNRIVQSSNGRRSSIGWYSVCRELKNNFSGCK